MNSLSFTHQLRRSTKTLRLHYGLEGMKYIIQMYEGEINGHGEKEGLPVQPPVFGPPFKLVSGEGFSAPSAVLPKV